MVEVLIALALLSLLSLITVTGMMVHARTAQSNLSQYKIAENARRFVDVVQDMALDATILRTNTGPAGADTVLTIGKPDPPSPGSTIYKQYAYIDDDNNPATIRDNRIVERDVNTPGNQCSPSSRIRPGRCTQLICAWETGPHHLTRRIMRSPDAATKVS
jgi:type II secretory pathway pseudopilin PulG